MKDDLYKDAKARVIETRRASISHIQRHLKIGYNRSARIMEDLEKEGVVSNFKSNGTREVLVMSEIYYSTDECAYNCDSIEEAIQDTEIGETITIYQGQGVRKRASDFCHFDSDTLVDHAIDNIGEFAEGWLSTSKEQELDLNAMVSAAVDEWADKHNLQPGFYGIKNKKELLVRVVSEYNYEIIEPQQDA